MTVVSGFPEPQEVEVRLSRMREASLASRLAARDSTLWGEDAEESASVRLGWTDLHVRAAGLIEQVHALREELAADGIDRIILTGMGGSALGARVLADAHGADLVVVDTSDPFDVADLCARDDLDRAALIVATKSGTTLETFSVASAFSQALLGRGIDPLPRLVAVTDPGTPLAEQAIEEGWRRVFLTDPAVGGRFSALAAFGLVPAGLAGTDIQQVVDEATDIAEALAADADDNPVLRLGAVLTAAHARDVRTLAIASTDPALAALPGWLEQLLGESSGKDGVGFLPVSCESIDAHGFRDAHAATALCFLGPGPEEPAPISGIAVAVDAPLGAQLLLWESAVALLCAEIGVDPFDQPDVEVAKERTRGLLEDAAAGGSPSADAPEDSPVEDATVDPTGAGAADTPAETTAEDSSADLPRTLNDGPITAELWGPAAQGIPTDATLTDALRGLFPDPDVEAQYLAVQAFLSAPHDAEARGLRALLAQKSGGTVAFGWGPQYLHSTGQFHKGGRPDGSFLFLIGDPESAPAVEIPQAGFTFAQLQCAQARGDAAVLAERGRPVVVLTLADRAEGIAHLRALLAELPDAPSRLPESEEEAVLPAETAEEPGTAAETAEEADESEDASPAEETAPEAEETASAATEVDAAVEGDATVDDQR